MNPRQAILWRVITANAGDKGVQSESNLSSVREKATRVRHGIMVLPNHGLVYMARMQENGRAVAPSAPTVARTALVATTLPELQAKATTEAPVVDYDTATADEWNAWVMRGV